MLITMKNIYCKLNYFVVLLSEHIRSYGLTPAVIKINLLRRFLSFEDIRFYGLTPAIIKINLLRRFLSFEHIRFYGLTPAVIKINLLRRFYLKIENA
jgi:hypothetical protein